MKQKIKTIILGLILALSLRSIAFPQTVVTPTGANIQAPSVTYPATTLTLTYTAGTVYAGTSATTINSGTLSLTNTEVTCTVASIQAGTDACNYVYWTTGSTLSTSTTFSTAAAAGNVLLYLCTTTGGNISGCLPASLLTGLSTVGSLSKVTGTGSVVLSNSPTLVSPILGAATGTSLTLAGNLVGQTQPSIAAAATLSLTTAQCGSVVLVGQATGEVVTLPAPSVGCAYDFVITTSNTSNSNEIRTDTATHFLLGAVEHAATGIAPLTFWADGSTIQAIKMDGSHLGGLVGSIFHVVGISTTQWEISGRNECTTVCTTAFNATP